MKSELQTVLDSINGTVNTFVTNQKAMQRQLDAIDLQTKERAAQFTATPSLVEKLQATPGFQQLITDRRGRAVLNLSGKETAMVLQQKTTITETSQGFMTTGVMPIDRISGITPEARQVFDCEGSPLRKANYDGHRRLRQGADAAQYRLART